MQLNLHDITDNFTLAKCTDDGLSDPTWRKSKQTRFCVRSFSDSSRFRTDPDVQVNVLHSNITLTTCNTYSRCLFQTILKKQGSTLKAATVWTTEPWKHPRLEQVHIHHRVAPTFFVKFCSVSRNEWCANTTGLYWVLDGISGVYEPCCEQCNKVQFSWMWSSVKMDSQKIFLYHVPMYHFVPFRMF